MFIHVLEYKINFIGKDSDAGRDWGTDEGLGSIPGQQTKIPTSHVAWPKKKKTTDFFLS